MMQRHGCGGLVEPAEVQVIRGGKVRILLGKRCSKCGMEMLSPETVLALEQEERAERAG